MVEHDTTVRHALCALSAAQEGCIPGRPSTLPEFALHQYRKAVRGVIGLKSTKAPHAVEKVLMTSLLLALTESSRGHHHSCLVHLVAGLKILEESQKQRYLEFSEWLDLAKALRWAFIRIDSQVLDIGGIEFGHGVQVHDGAGMAMPSVVKDTDECMFHIDLLYNRIVHHLMEWEPFNSVEARSEETEQALMAERQHYLHELNKITKACRNFMDSQPKDNSGRTEATRLAISLAVKIITIALDISDFVVSEAEFDKYIPQFQAIVEESEAFIEVSSRRLDPCAGPTSRRQSPASATETRPHPQDRLSQESPTMSTSGQASAHRSILTISSGCVLPLYFVAAHCRHSPTRHKALHLLRTCNRREGLWDASLAAEIAEKLITIEESRTRALLHERGYQFEPATDHTSGLYIPDEVRIRTVVMHYGEEGGGRAEFSMQSPWSVVPTADGRYQGLGSVEEMVFGKPGAKSAGVEFGRCRGAEQLACT